MVGLEKDHLMKGSLLRFCVKTFQKDYNKCCFLDFIYYSLDQTIVEDVMLNGTKETRR